MTKRLEAARAKRIENVGKRYEDLIGVNGFLVIDRLKRNGYVSVSYESGRLGCERLIELGLMRLMFGNNRLTPRGQDLAEYMRDEGLI